MKWMNKRGVLEMANVPELRKHECRKLEILADCFGDRITSISKYDGNLWIMEVKNSETHAKLYTSIDFCPLCGVML